MFSIPTEVPHMVSLRATLLLKKMVGIVEKVAPHLTDWTVDNTVGFELDTSFDFGVYYPYNFDKHDFSELQFSYLDRKN